MALTTSDKLEARAALFKALGHPSRLLIMNLLRSQPRHGEELATILGLNPATVSHHLSKLAAVGLVSAEKQQYYQMFRLNRDLLSQTVDQLLLQDLTDNVDESAFRNKVLKAFLVRGRLKTIPAQRKKRRIVLERLVEEFEFEQTYTELEVNRTLVAFHDDVATLRRELIAEKLMSRTPNGIYQRSPKSG